MPDNKPTHYDAGSDGPSRGTLMILGGLVAVLVVGGIIALVAAGRGGDDAPSLADIEPPAVSGRALSDFAPGTDDPAIGLEMPFVEGVDFSGAVQKLEPTGKPQGIVFLAHWCPHCQNEVPVVQDWLDDGGLPEGAELRSVASGIDPSRANYPPDAWLDHEGWTPSIVVDITGQVSTAYGLNAYPYWVFVDGDGKIVRRSSGSITPSELESIFSSLL
ncbi:MAG: TlpA family protein disulfide reductase [Actinomycetia bacterium]|nr:TlpA family protein disulfide reductase [Actinomycetes bacterium]MCP4961055.1 TlpA family protein disulfide reductase [Actinomycetes bacterium]